MRRQCDATCRRNAGKEKHSRREVRSGGGGRTRTSPHCEDNPALIVGPTVNVGAIGKIVVCVQNVTVIYLIIWLL